MRFVYKINSAYDGFHPSRITHRLLDGRFLVLGWKRYLDEVSKGDEVWIYFRGPHRFDDGVYAKGRVAAVDLARQELKLRLFKYDGARPITDKRTSQRVEEIIQVRYRQVFLLPEDWETVTSCNLFSTGDSCVERKCEWCPTWKRLSMVGRGQAYSPPRASRLTGFAPAYWAIPPRCFISSYRVTPDVHQTSQILKAFKTGNANLAYPLAAAMFESLQKRDLQDFDCVVPVPLSPEKAKRNEIHRTRLLAAELATILGKPMKEVLTLSAPISKRTMQAAGYSYRDFERKYAAILQVDPSVTAFRRILLVDDVCTHGGTLKVICDALYAANPGIQVVASVATQMIVKAAVANVSTLVK